MNKNPLHWDLPAPNWSPTGEEGYWVWRNEKWSWLTNEEYEEQKKEVEKKRFNIPGIPGLLAEDDIEIPDFIKNYNEKKSA